MQRNVNRDRKSDSIRRFVAQWVRPLLLNVAIINVLGGLQTSIKGVFANVAA